MNEQVVKPAEQMPGVTFEQALHHQKAVIFIRFVDDPVLNKWVRQLTGAFWSHTQKAWYVVDNAHYRRQFGIAPPLVGKTVIAQIHPVNQPALQRLIETLQLKSYSASTLQTYRNEFAQLLYVLKAVPVDSLDANRLRSYFLYCVNTLKLSENTLHSRINAVKFFFEQVLHRERFFFEIPRPKKPSILPKVMSTADIKRLFAVTTNLKHNTMLKARKTDMSTYRIVYLTNCGNII
ncbi:phage integrase N-terminal SAM-like domain-containing protein [Spirosoma taeanense]|uniref:phage integrase N-terminal SAM-like domain-containing protein n=1 Tax=Spirosoma taeanense TaxID=2735870 RepID=UPI0014933DAF|nr:phage integrase N-terminal SAM-like domain-containing protein [Spirosoma taeanense]